MVLYTPYITEEITARTGLSTNTPEANKDREKEEGNWNTFILKIDIRSLPAESHLSITKQAKSNVCEVLDTNS